jgi:hypothetical protein
MGRKIGGTPKGVNGELRRFGVERASRLTAVPGGPEGTGRE